MEILSIGNSFSQDSQRYLHKLAKHDSEELKTVNLYISGCELGMHYLNILEDKAAYDLQFNGDSTGIQVSIKQVLISHDWDAITLQQASHFSAKSETYFPYIKELAAYIRKYRPHAKIFMHQTWAYEDGSERLKNVAGFATARDMFATIRDSYEKAANAIKADGIIPCGEAMLKASEMGVKKIHRDTFHASLGAGRYLLALCWYKKLLGKDISENTFKDFDEPITEEERKIVIAAVNAVL